VSDLQSNFLEGLAPISFESKGTCLIDIEPNRLYQIILNLVTNASNYSKGQPVKIICQKGKNGTNFAEILVVDNGIGIDDSNANEMFKHLTRVNGSNLAPGSGLGLFISKKLIESMGGQIWAKNRKRKGSVFGLKLKKSMGKTPLMA
jgi:signal transduction histidine kinase